MQAVGAFRGQDMCGSNLELLALVDGLSTVVEGHPDPVQGWREKFRGGNSCRSASGYLIVMTCKRKRPTCNHRVFRPTLIASIQLREPELIANEPAMTRLGLHFIGADQD